MADAQRLQQIHSNVSFPHIGSDYFSSKAYLNLFPRNKKWIESELDIDEIKEYDPKYLNEFSPKDYNPNYPYFNTLQSALNQFNKWRNLEHNENGWKSLKQKKNIGFEAWWTSLPNEAISAIKAQMKIPYAVPIIVGTITNNVHLPKYNKNMGLGHLIQNITPNCCIYHHTLPRPIPFISARDLMVLQCIYILPNCEVLFIEKSIDQHPKDKYINNKKVVRGNCTLHVYHIRPDYNSSDKHKNSLVTEYAHGNPSGSIPSWLIDQLIDLQAQCVITLTKHIQSIQNTLYKPGVLHIPYPLLKQIKVFKKKKNHKEEEEELMSPSVESMEDNTICSICAAKTDNDYMIEQGFTTSGVMQVFRESSGGYFCLFLLLLCCLSIGIVIGAYLSFQTAIWSFGVIWVVVVTWCLFYGARIYYISRADYREYYRRNKTHFD